MHFSRFLYVSSMHEYWILKCYKIMNSAQMQYICGFRVVFQRRNALKVSVHAGFQLRLTTLVSGTVNIYRPQHFLYFLPLPHGQGSLGYIFFPLFPENPYSTFNRSKISYTTGHTFAESRILSILDRRSG